MYWNLHGKVSVSHLKYEYIDLLFVRMCSIICCIICLLVIFFARFIIKALRLLLL